MPHGVDHDEAEGGDDEVDVLIFRRIGGVCAGVVKRDFVGACARAP